ncbi:MAG: hypothetical protein ACR2PT_06805 [Endozoicomonas sp.]
MEFCSVQTFMQLVTPERDSSPASETLAERNSNFAEEASFFLGLFKNRQVRPMPDQPLMMILQKARLRKKQRTVTKKDKTGKGYFRRREHEPDTGQKNNSEEFKDQAAVS